MEKILFTHKEIIQKLNTMDKGRARTNGYEGTKQRNIIEYQISNYEENVMV